MSLVDLDALCTCGHTREEHDLPFNDCAVDGCPCLHFEEIDPDDQ